MKNYKKIRNKKYTIEVLKLVFIYSVLSAHIIGAIIGASYLLSNYFA